MDLLCLGDLGDNWDRWMMSLVIKKNSSSTKLINQLIQNGEIYDPNDSETYSEYQNPWGVQENKKFLVGTSFHSSSIARHFHSCFGSRRKRLRQLGYHAVAIAADLFVTALLRFRAVPHRFASGIALAASLLTSSLEIWLHPYCLRLCGLWDRIGKSLLG